MLWLTLIIILNHKQNLNFKRKEINECISIPLAFKPWCWKRLKRPWASRGSNASILKQIHLIGKTEDEAVPHWKDRWWSSNTLASWCKQSTHWERPWCWERLKAKGEEASRGWDGKGLDGITNSIDWNLGEVWEMVRDRKAWHAAVHGVKKSRAWLSNWTTITARPSITFCKLRFITKLSYIPLSSQKCQIIYWYIFTSMAQILKMVAELFSQLHRKKMMRSL